MIDRLKHIKAIALDVDGVLTDGTYWWGADGGEMKRFCFSDGTGITMAMRAGLLIALISGESSVAGMTLVQRYADKLKIKDTYKGCHDKAAAVKDFATRHGLELFEICFIGDDVIDIPALSIVGFSAVPADAHASSKVKASYVATKRGGLGAVREVIDLVMEQRDPG